VDLRQHDLGAESDTEDRDVEVVAATRRAVGLAGVDAQGDDGRGREIVAEAPAL